MQPQTPASPREIIKKVTEELGKACADKFRRLESDEKVYVQTVRSVSKLSEIVARKVGVPCCFGNTVNGTAPDDATCLSMNGQPGGCKGGGKMPPLDTRQTVIRKITEVLAQLFANRIDEGGPQTKMVYEAMLQKLAPLFKDANDGLDVSLVSCRLPDGTPLPGLTKEQCDDLGGSVID